MRQTCAWCGHEFEAARRDNIFCSTRCKNRASEWRRNGGWDFDPSAMASIGRDKPVSVDEVVSAVVGVRSAMAVFSAAAITGSPDMRPLCSRLEMGLSRVLEGEGL